VDDLKNNEINELVDAKTDLENKVVCEKMSLEESKIWPIDLDGILPNNRFLYHFLRAASMT
jgi:hypothetical protein